MKTIKAAVASADPGDIVLVAPGVYREAAPIDVTVNNLSIIGQSLRSCFVHPTPATEESILFRVNSGTQISNFSMAGMKASGTRGGHSVDTDSTYGLPTNQGWAIAFTLTLSSTRAPTSRTAQRSWIVGSTTTLKLNITLTTALVVSLTLTT